MSDELGLDPLPEGCYDGVVERISFKGKTNVTAVIRYRIETADGTRRLREDEMISAPKSSASYFFTTRGLGRIEDLLRIKGMTLADVGSDWGKKLPEMLNGVALRVVTRNRHAAGYSTPVVVRVEKP